LYVFPAILPYLSGEYTLQSRHYDTLKTCPLFVNTADPTFEPSREGDTSFAANVQVFRVGANLATTLADGTSNTIGYCQRYARCGYSTTWWQHGGRRFVDQYDRPVYDYPPMQRRPTIADPPYGDVQPARDAFTGETRASVPGLTFQSRPSPEACDFRIPQTPYESLQVAMMDGSVQSVGAGVSEKVFWSAITPNWGEVGGLD